MKAACLKVSAAACICSPAPMPACTWPASCPTQPPNVDCTHRRPPQVDCVTASAGFGSNGCSGGRSFEVMDYVHSFRATTEADYAYTGKNGAACLEPNTSAATPGSLTAGGYNYQYAPTRASMQAALVNGGPLVIYFRCEGSCCPSTAATAPPCSRSLE